MSAPSPRAAAKAASIRGEYSLVGANGEFLWVSVADGTTGEPAGRVRIFTSAGRVSLTAGQAQALADHLHNLPGGAA